MASSDQRTDDGRRGAPDVVRVGDLSDEEVEKLVARRRFKRRLKALAAVGLAFAAGVFLACSGRMKPDRVDAGDRDSGGDGPDSGRRDGGMDAGVGMDASVPRDTGARVDVGFHRDGMPVPDNLLE